MSEVVTRSDFSSLLPDIRFKAWFKSSLRKFGECMVEDLSP